MSLTNEKAIAYAHSAISQRRGRNRTLDSKRADVQANLARKRKSLEGAIAEHDALEIQYQENQQDIDTLTSLIEKLENTEALKAEYGEDDWQDVEAYLRLEIKRYNWTKPLKNGY